MGLPRPRSGNDEAVTSRDWRDFAYAYVLSGNGVPQVHQRGQMSDESRRALARALRREASRIVADLPAVANDEESAEEGGEQ